MAAVTRPGLSRGTLSRITLGRLRLASQRLIGPGCTSAADAVRWMTAMQAQDLPAALWAVGQRVPGSRLLDVRAALDRGEVVRSWPMRGTLHLVASEDLRWMLAITADRTLRALAARHRQLGITDADVQAAREAALGLVSGGGAASRDKLFRAFEAAGQPTAGQRGVHLLLVLCLRSWLVQGPLAGKQQLLVACEEWIKDSRMLDREEGTAEWLLRYVRSHGPATERDFAWWTGIPLTDVRAALAAVREQLVELVFEGVSYWLAPATAELLDGVVPGARSVLLLPGFDEFLLGYTDRSHVLDPEQADKVVPGGNGVFGRQSLPGARWSAPGRRCRRPVPPASCPNPLTRLTGCGLQHKSPLRCRPRSTADSSARRRPGR